MIEVCKGTNLSVFLQRIKQKEEMENKKPIVLNNLEEWDFTDYIDSLIQKEEAVDLEFKIAKDGLPNSLWDTYSSFANTDGGVIILGVKEYKQQFIIEGLTKEQISQYKKDFWNQINNPDCVNENLLSDNDLYEGCYKGDVYKRQRYTSQRDKQKGELFVHGFTLAMTAQNRFYRPISEQDTHCLLYTSLLKNKSKK